MRLGIISDCMTSMVAGMRRGMMAELHHLSDQHTRPD